jgi:uncharacterized protein YggE
MRIITLLLLFSTTTFSQSNQKTIVVQGKAKVKVQPDIAVITFSIQKSDTSQAKAMAKANQQIEELSSIFKQQGLSNRQVKISDYRIEASYESERRKKEYTVANTLVATLRLDSKQINDVLKNIEAKKMNGLEVSFEYALTDSLEKYTRTQLVQKAIEEAKNNAINISQSLKIHLKGIINVSKHGLQPLVYEKLMDISVGSAPSIETYKGINLNSVFGTYDVEDKELTEEIVIVYEIGS